MLVLITGATGIGTLLAATLMAGTPSPYTCTVPKPISGA
jgi:hypothetical protein